MVGSTSNLPARPTRKEPKGHDVRALDPSASSDTGARPDHEIDADRVAAPEEAGLGSGLDELELDDAWFEHDRGEH